MGIGGIWVAGTRIAIVGFPPVNDKGMLGCFGSMAVSGAGQYWASVMLNATGILSVN